MKNAIDRMIEQDVVDFLLEIYFQTGKNLETKASYGKLTPKSVNNDSTTGHWELAGVVSSEPFSLYPEGFPSEIVEEVEKGTGQKFIGNKHASGTEIINELGKEHLETNKLILYTIISSIWLV